MSRFVDCTPVINTRGGKIECLFQPSLIEQDGNFRFRDLLAIDFHNDVMRDSGSVDAFVWVLDSAEDGAIFEPGVCVCHTVSKFA